MRRIPPAVRPLVVLVLLLAVSSCTGDGARELAEPVEDVDVLPDGAFQPSYAIVDGSTDGGNPHFHWLYPISTSPSWSGVFDATLASRVTVEICEVAGDACSGPPIRTFSTSAADYWDQIRVSTRRQHYLVYWSSAGTDPATDYRVRVLLDGTRELGYADVDVVASAGELGAVDPATHVGLAVGSWLPVTFRLEEGLDAADAEPAVAVTAPADGAEVGPGPVTLAGTATDEEDGDLSASLSWSSDVDGALGTGASLEATLTPGPHLITAEVADGAGQAASAAVAVTALENQPPQVSISSPLDGEGFVEGDDVVLAATAGDPDDGTDLSPAILWTAEPDIPGITPGPALSLQPAPGTYELTATVADALGLEGSASVTVTVTADEAPVVTITGPADGTTVQEGATLTLTGAASDAVDGDLSGAIEWSSDLDGALGTGASVDAALSVGSHVVTASVADSRDATSTATVSVTVAPNTPPEITITEPADGTSVVEGTSVSFSAIATDAQDGDLTAELGWSADGVGELGDGATVDAVLPVGTHVVTATVADALGLEGSASVTVTVTADEAPVVTITGPADGTTVQEGATLTLTGAASDAVDGDLSGAIEWSSDLDGALGTGASVDAALSVGSHVVTASVADSRGTTSTTSVSVAVAPNTPPEVTITGPADGAVFEPGEVVSLAAAASDAEDGDLSAGISWSSDQDGPLGTGATLQPSLSGGGHRITAAATDALGATGSASVDVLVGIVGVQQTVTVPIAGTASLPITLAEPAPASGLTLAVESADPAVVEVTTPTVDVAPGDRAANATLRGVAPGEVAITVSTPDLGSDQATATVSGELRLDPGTLRFTGGFGPGTFSLGLYSGGSAAVAPPGGLEVTLAADDPACAALPATVTIPQGLGGVDFDVSAADGADLPCAATARATAQGLDPAEAGVAIEGAPSIEFTPGEITLLSEGVGSGLMARVTGRLQVSDHGGAALTLTSGDPSTLLLSRGPSDAGAATVTVQIPDGTRGFRFWIHGVEGATGEVELEATAEGFAGRTLTANVVEPYIRLTGVPTQREVFGDDTRPSFQVGIRPGGTSFRVQPPRTGSVVQAVLTTSDTELAAFDLGDETFADAVTVESSVNSDGDPSFGSGVLQANAIGVVTIAASAPGFLPHQAEKEMTLVGSGINAPGGTIGAGLMAPVEGSLSARPNEDTPVTIVSNDPSKLLVSFVSGTSDAQVATDSITSAPLSRTGRLRFSYWLHVVEGSTGTATYTVSAPGFEPTTVTVTADPDLEYTIGAFTATGGGSLDQTIETLDRLTYSANIRLAGGSSLGGQRIRSDHPSPPALTLTSSDPAVGGFTVPGSEDLPAQVTIPFAPRTSRAQTQFVPDQPGTTTVTATNPTGDLRPYSDTSGVVTVVGTPIQASDVTVGESLMEETFFYLGQYAPEDVTVTVTSSDPDVARVGSSGFGTPGASYEYTVRQGNSRIETAIHGISRGTATLTVDAPGYETATAQVTVVQPVIHIERGLPRTMRTFDDPNPFTLWLGHDAGSSFDTQRLRTGAGPLPVTVTSTNSDVGLLQAASAAAGSATSSITVEIPEGVYVIGEGNPEAPAIVPVVNGTTEITLAAPGFVQLPGASYLVTVESPVIQVAAPTRVGGGLYRADNLVRLGSPYGSPNHGGVTVTLESSDPTRLLLGPNDGSSPAATHSVFLPDGSTDLRFAVHGVSGTTGTNVQIRATAQGFVDGTDFVDVVTPRFRVSGLGGTQTAGGGNDAFDLRLETANYEYGWVSDADGLPVTVETSDPSVLQVGGDGTTGTSATVVIPRGDYWLLSTLFVDPVAAGTATVTVSAPGFDPYTRTLTVN